MTKGKTAKAPAGNDDRTLNLSAQEGETAERTHAKAAIGPVVRHTVLAEYFATSILGKNLKPPITDTAEVIREHVGDIGKGDLTVPGRLLAAQAISLDAIFTDLASRAAMNRGEYLNAAETYMRLALKAQAACRATIDSLAKLHQPREQTVRHVHVNEGGHAVVAEQFHHHAGGRENAKIVNQPHAPGTAAGPGQSATLPSPHPLGDGVPIAGREGEAAMQDARRDKPRRA
jgi:hypothetical protein